MITVTIKINGKKIGEVSAHQIGKCEGVGFPEDWRWYGVIGKKKTILHGRNHGALELAKSMLKCIEEKDLRKESW